MIVLNGKKYKIVENVNDAFQEEVVTKRFAEVLRKYDYIVGDWGYSQLRMKGFYNVNHAKASFDTRIDHLEDYLYEYCNFGCPYFILQKVE
ncbi:MAG TPA: YutD family protein [Pseudogracilibacillus sp.]|nr:YutD family protein [Pseudogracilibacillus sp.]